MRGGIGKGSQKDAKDSGLHSRSHQGGGTEGLCPSAPSSLPLKALEQHPVPTPFLLIIAQHQGVMCKKKKTMTRMCALRTSNTPLSTAAYLLPLLSEGLAESDTSRGQGLTGPFRVFLP